MTDRKVDLRVMSASDAPLLGNLLELYIHDLSVLFPNVRLGPNGRYGYPHLDSYLSGSGDRFAFLILCAQAIAGFVLVRRGSPVAEDPNVLDVAEFFVLRQFRGAGIGHAAAHLLWKRLPATWTVRAASVNTDAVSFWRKVVARYTNNAANQSDWHDGSKSWVVFSFESGR